MYILEIHAVKKEKNEFIPIKIGFINEILKDNYTKKSLM